MSPSSLYWFTQLHRNWERFFGRVLKCATQLRLSLSGRLLEAGKECLSKASGLWDFYLTLFSGPLVLVAVVVSTNQGDDCAFVPKIGVSLPQKHSEPCCWERTALARRKKAKCQRSTWGDRVKHLFHRLYLAEGVLRMVVSGPVLFLSPLFNIHEMRSRQQKANPWVAGIAVAVQENRFPQCFKSSCVEDYK